MSFSEMRRHPRFTVDLEALVSIGERQVAARTRDLSRSGICLITPEVIAPGTEIGIGLVLTFGQAAASEPLQVLARVVWCTPICGSYQVGGMFVAMTEEQERFVEMFLRFLDGTLIADTIPEPGSTDDEETGRREDDPETAIEKDDPFKS